MKANELMIGDFLRYKRNFPDTHLQGKIVVVCGIRGRVDVRTIDDGNFHESVHPDWLEPIPLTPEIIEKNFPQEGNCGLKYSPHIGRTCDLENGNTLWIGKWYNSATRDEKERTGVDPAEGWWEIVYCEHPYMYECGMKVRFVHELQHALRLCGIEKEIEL